MGMSKTAKRKKKKADEIDIYDVDYQGKIWKVIGYNKSGAQGVPWLSLRRGGIVATAKEYEVTRLSN